MDKKKILLAIFTCVVLLSMIFIGCQVEEPISKEDRMDQFEDDLNQDIDRGDIYKNLHPDIRDPWKDSGAWVPSSLSYLNAPFSFGSLSYGSDTVTGTISYFAVTNDPLVVEMAKDGDDWYITKVTIGGFQIIPAP